MTWHIPSSFAWVESDDAEDHVWVLNAQRNMIFGISAVALDIWMACDGAKSADQVVKTLVTANGWAKNDVAEPVAEFIELLVEQEFLEESAP